MFRTTITIAKSENSIQLQDQVLCLGSCFAQTFGEYLNRHKVNAITNPFGIVFNPISIAKLMQLALSDENFAPGMFGEREGIHFHYNAHSDCNKANQTDLIEYLEQQKNTLKEALTKANWLVLTFGTAWVYSLKSNNSIVANCHKVPANAFQKTLLSPEEITNALRTVFQALKKINPNLSIITTVSPIRHIKDTLPSNSISKGILHYALHQLTEMHPYVSYFPSYELLMDDLRDYRFYKEDMVHPSNQAIAYIQEKFAKAYFSERLQEFVPQWDKIIKGLAHRPMQINSESYLNFLIKLENKILEFDRIVDISKELEQINKLRAKIKN